MLKFQSLEDENLIVQGDQITRDAMPLIARFVGGNYHVERHDNHELPWIEIHKGRKTLIAHAGDYFITKDDGEKFEFVERESFEQNWEEIYDPEIDGDENKYFDPEVDIHREPKEITTNFDELDTTNLVVDDNLMLG